MPATLTPSRVNSGDRPAVPYTIRLPHDQTLVVEVPADFVRYERDGTIGFTIKGMEYLDRVRAVVTPIEESITPGHIAALRMSLGMTQQQFGKCVGVNKLTVSRWERGGMRPGSDSLAKIRKLRMLSAKRGVVLSATAR